MGIVRKTQSLNLILSEFQYSTSALSAVYLAKRFDEKMNKTTVYRVLDKLEDDGILHSFLDRNGIKWYAKCSKGTKTESFETHPHFQCLNCGKVECLDIEIQIPEVPNREVVMTQILIQGKCESCLREE